MGAISKLVSAGVKKLTKPAAKEGASAAHVADLRRRIANYEKMLKNKEYGKDKIMTKDGIETRLSAHRSYLKKALGSRADDPTSMAPRTELGGKKNKMATSTGEVDKARQQDATIDAQVDSAIQKGKAKVGKKNKETTAKAEAYYSDTSGTKKAASEYDKANEELQRAIKDRNKMQATQDSNKVFGGKKPSKKRPVMEGRDFIHSGTKKQATKEKVAGAVAAAGTVLGASETTKKKGK